MDAVEVTVGDMSLREPGAECKTGRTAGRGTGKGSQCDQTLNLNELDGLSGLMTEEETLVAKMMAEQGNSVDFTA